MRAPGVLLLAALMILQLNTLWNRSLSPGTAEAYHPIYIISELEHMYTCVCCTYSSWQMVLILHHHKTTVGLVML